MLDCGLELGVGAPSRASGNREPRMRGRGIFRAQVRQLRCFALLPSKSAKGPYPITLRKGMSVTGLGRGKGSPVTNGKSYLYHHQIGYFAP